jgi:tetratricopeptide (TPR) repeat protein
MMAAVRKVIEDAKNNPKDFQAQLRAASAFDQIGRGAETIEYLKKAYDINPAEAGRQQVPAYIGDWYMKERDYVAAETWFRRALEHEPNNPDIMRELGTTFLDREPADADRGIQYIQSALKLSPKDSHALLHLVQAYLIKKDAKSAEEALQRLKQADPNGSNTRMLETQVENLKAGRPVTVPKE